MEIFGLMKMTLLDFPSKVACTVFAGGCDFRCPFCHNGDIVLKRGEAISEEEIFAFLKKRRGILDGVCISGGEALLSSDLIFFMEKVASLGFCIKLDTNGSNPRALKAALESGFCDYVAMDVKNSFDKYPETIGVAGFDTDRIAESIELIRKSGIPHEFRTTVVRELHTENDIRALTAHIPNAEHYFIQSYTESECVFDKSLSPFSRDELSRLLAAARENVPNAELRGI